MCNLYVYQLYVVQRFDGKYKSFRTRVPPNLEKLKCTFYGKYATGELSFSLAMVGSDSNLNKKMKGLEADTGKRVGDNDDGDTSSTPDEIECIPPAKSSFSQDYVMLQKKEKWRRDV